VLLGTTSKPCRFRKCAALPIFISVSCQEGATMFDDSVRLRENPHLLALLSHYAQLGSEDRATWRDRLMQMEGVATKQMSALHGELIAFDWIEQNTGQATCLKDGTLAACYRVTPHGLRTYRRVYEVEAHETEKSQPRFPRMKKEKAEVLAVATSE
jgi:hypothetical protein